jgi:hypothetical protein
MGRVRRKVVSARKLSVRKRSVKKGSGFDCLFDGLACARVQHDFDVYGHCYSIWRDGKIHRVCPRFKVELPDASFCEDLVRKALLEDSIRK